MPEKLVHVARLSPSWPLQEKSAVGIAQSEIGALNNGKSASTFKSKCNEPTYFFS